MTRIAALLEGGEVGAAVVGEGAPQGRMSSRLRAAIAETVTQRREAAAWLNIKPNRAATMAGPANGFPHLHVPKYNHSLMKCPKAIRYVKYAN